MFQCHKWIYNANSLIFDRVAAKISTGLYITFFHSGFLFLQLYNSGLPCQVEVEILLKSFPGFLESIISHFDTRV